MSVIFTRAPLRISLGGGGTDLPSYYREHGGFLVGGAIDKYVYMLTHTVFQRRYRMKYSSSRRSTIPREIRHPILREALLRHWNGDPLEIASSPTFRPAPASGSSGAFTVCLLKALALARRIATTPGRLAEDACEIEIDILGEPVGKQDQYVAAHGGICAYTFNPRRHRRRRAARALAEDARPAAQQPPALLHRRGARGVDDPRRPGRAHRSAATRRCSTNLHRTKEIGLESRDAARGRRPRAATRELMHEHWENKRERSPGMATERIDDLYTLARRSGAIGGKLVGAGGGGFLLVYARRPDDTRQAMAAARRPELRFDFEFQGCFGVEYT